MEWLWLPPVAAGIGWLTNVVAVRLLFRPHRPWSFPFFPGWRLQGVLPRRQEELARTLGEVVSRELLTRDQLLRQVLRPEVKSEISTALIHTLERAMEERLPTFLPGSFRAAILGYARNAAASEVHRFLERDLDELVRLAVNQIRVADLVRERVANLDLVELEALVFRVARRELRHIEWLGAVLGFAVGLVQVGLVVAF